MVPGIMQSPDTRPTRPTEYDERVPDLFVPDLLLASQYADRTRPGAGARSPERRLMSAVLEDAVHVYRTHAAARSGRQHDLFAEAEAWIESDDRSYLFSFESVCDHLGLDAGYLRRGLRAHKARTRGDEGPALDVPGADVAPEEDWLEASGA